MGKRANDNTKCDQILTQMTTKRTTIAIKQAKGDTDEFEINTLTTGTSQMVSYVDEIKET